MEHANKLKCPRCGSRSGFRKLEMDDSSNSGCLMLLFGGIIPYLIFSSSRENKMVCTRCGYAFSPAVAEKRAAYLFVSLAMLTLLILFVILMWMM